MSQNVEPGGAWTSSSVYAFVVGLGIGLGIHQTYLMPAQLGTLRDEVADAKKTVAKSKDDTARIAVLSGQLDDAKKAASEAQLFGLLSLGSPYPSGLAQVKLGELATQIDTSFPADRIDKKSKYSWTVETDHAHFKRVTYYLDNPDKDPKVTRIIYFVHYQSPLSNEALLKSRMVDSLGLPTIVSGDDEFKWVLPTGSIVQAYSGWYTVIPDETVTGSTSKTPTKRK